MFSQGEIQACVEIDIEILEIFNADFHGYFVLYLTTVHIKNG